MHMRLLCNMPALLKFSSAFHNKQDLLLIALTVIMCFILPEVVLIGGPMRRGWHIQVHPLEA